MSTSDSLKNSAVVPAYEYSWEQLARMIFEKEAITEGFWTLGANLAFGGITGEWVEAGKAMPTGMVGIQSVAVFPASGPGPMAFDAAVLNGKKRAAKGSRRLAA